MPLNVHVFVWFAHSTSFLSMPQPAWDHTFKCFCSACKMLNCKSITSSNSCLVQQVPFISFILKP